MGSVLGHLANEIEESGGRLAKFEDAAAPAPALSSGALGPLDGAFGDGVVDVV